MSKYLTNPIFSSERLKRRIEKIRARHIVSAGGDLSKIEPECEIKPQVLEIKGQGSISHKPHENTQKASIFTSPSFKLCKRHAGLIRQMRAEKIIDKKIAERIGGISTSRLSICRRALGIK